MGRSVLNFAFFMLHFWLLKRTILSYFKGVSERLSASCVDDAANRREIYIRLRILLRKRNIWTIFGSIFYIFISLFWRVVGAAKRRQFCVPLRDVC